MIDQIKRESLKHGDKAEIVPIKYMQDIKHDIKNLQNTVFLNNFQKYIVNDLYMLDLPEIGFEICSIIIVASPSPPLAKIIFSWKGKRIPLMLPASYIDKDTAPIHIEKYLNEYLNSRGHYVKHTPSLPRKLLAVRSGLGVYGRNNICYVKGMGSFLNLSTYFSNIPCTEECWHQINQMDLCKNCKACLSNCPTAAITNDRFLINNERCLTYFNEVGEEWDFPLWIHPSSHNSIYGCMRCQTVCPMNKEYLENVIEPVDFTERETQLLLEGKPLERFSEELKKKVEALNMFDYLGALPRNLKVLLNSEV